MPEQVKNALISPSCTLASAVTAGVSTSFDVSDATNLPASGTFRLTIKGAASDGSADAVAVVGAITGVACSSVTWETVGSQTDFAIGAQCDLSHTAGAVAALLATKADTADSRFPTADEKAAMDAADSPSAANPVATERSTVRKVSAQFTGVVPTDAASPATFGTPTSSTALASGRSFDCQDPACFTILGAEPIRNASSPYRFGTSGMYTGGSSTPPWAIEFDITTAGTALELLITLSGGSWRIVVDGEIGQTYTDAVVSGSSRYLPITLASAGSHRIRIEMSDSGTFQGVRLAALTDTIAATFKDRPRCLVLGDSFSECTISDSGSFHDHDGWVQRLGYITGWDVWSCAKGGTGILNPGSGVKFRDRVALDVLPFNPDIVLIAGGINDAETGTTYAALKAEYDALIDSLATVPTVVSISPFWPRGLAGDNDGILKVAQAVKDSAAGKGIPHVDLLTQPGPKGLTATVTQTMNISGDQLYCDANVLEYADAINWAIVGDAALGHEVEALILPNGYSGGNHYLGVGSAPYNAHNVGEPVRSACPAYITGTGKQGATTGNGNADVVTGGDGTHPTEVGHNYIAHCVAGGLARVL